MKKYWFVLWSFLFSLVLASCAPDLPSDTSVPAEDDGQSQDDGTTTEYSLSNFRSSTEGISFSTDLNASDSNGNSYTGTLAMAARAAKQVGGVMATPIDLLLTLSDGVDSMTITGTSYVDSDRNLISYTIQTTGLTCSPATMKALPLNVEVGDFGVDPTLNCNDGTTRESNWRVESSVNGHANFVTAEVIKDSNGTVTSTSETIYEINTDGEILNLDIKVVNTASGYTLYVWSSTSAPYIPTAPETLDTGFITWTGSANGEWVIDASDDGFKFLYPSGFMYFGSTIISNVWVSNANIYYNGVHIGYVSGVQSTTGQTIAGMTSLNGYWLDFYGPQNSLTWTVASTRPVLP